MPTYIVMTVCPGTLERVSTNHVVTGDAFQLLGGVSFQCKSCGEIHERDKSDLWLGEEFPPSE